MWLIEDDEFYKKIIKCDIDDIYSMIPIEKLKESPFNLNNQLNKSFITNIIFKDELKDFKYIIKNNDYVYTFINNNKNYRIVLSVVHDVVSQFKKNDIYKVDIYVNNYKVNRDYLEIMNIRDYYYLLKIISVVIINFLNFKKSNILLFDYDYSNHIYNKFITELIKDITNDFEQHIQLSNFTINRYGKYIDIKSY